MVTFGGAKKSRQAATNPVARAIARGRLMESLVDAKIKFYMADEGEEIAPLLRETARLVTTTMMAARRGGVALYSTEMNAALIGLCSMMDDGYRWRKSATVMMDDALDAVLLVTPELKAADINYSMQELGRLENEERLSNGRARSTERVPQYATA